MDALDKQALDLAMDMHYPVSTGFMLSMSKEEAWADARSEADRQQYLREARAAITAGWTKGTPGTPMTDDLREEPCSDVKNALNQIYGRLPFADNHAMQILAIVEAHGWAPPGYLADPSA
jgi:hypothetical protein